MTDAYTTTAPTPDPPTRGADTDSLLGIVQHYAQLLLRRKLIVAVVLAISVTAGWLWLNQQTPIYRATAQVIIDTDPPKVFWNVRDVVELGSPKQYRGSITYFETQYRIINSRPVAELVLNELNLWNSEHLLGLDARTDLTPKEKQAALEKANMANVLAGRIGVRPVPNSMLVFIDFEDSDKEFATEVVNAVARAYESYNLNYKKNIVRDAVTDLKKTVGEQRSALEVAQNGLLEFEKEHNVGSIEAQQKAINDRLDQLNLDLTKTQSQRLRLEAQAATLAKYAEATDPFGVSATLILDNEVIRSLKQRIVGVQAEYAALESRYLDKHPEVIAKKKELGTLNTIARKEIRNIAQSVQKQLAETRRVEDGLQKSLDDAAQQQRAIGGLAIKYARLVDDANKLKETYGIVSQRLAETAMSSQFEANNVRRLEDAVVPGAPVYPRRGLVLFGSFILGLVLAFAVALLADFADATITNWVDLEQRTGYKVLGVVPLIGTRTPDRSRMTAEEFRERDLFIARNPNSNIAEASRTLRTNLLFMSKARHLKTLLISSANPVEGKSLLATHVATSMASSGSRVLLIEADMRRPRLAVSFGLNADVGLSTCLVSEDDVMNHIQPTEVENLHVMLSGQVPPNPTELLHTPRFNELLERTRENYDTVVFDSPPLLPVADAMVLAQKLDGALVVVRAGKTSRHALRHALRRLETVEADILGLVLNSEARRGKGKGYGYGYGGYGYGYGGYSLNEDKNAKAAG
ncbi:MAG: polysaccharide biosynthesis tyrosine autokinase [Deltaproteobacteria bacterium]|nr:MAG: polysaccharide biosynthesis tyrosine autokinase [Deltaproteobacteria bacterium]